MSRNYNNWGRLIEAVLRREQLREMARQTSINSSYLSDFDSSSSSYSSPPPHLSPRLSSLELDAMDDERPYWAANGARFFLSVESREITISCGESSEHQGPGWIFSELSVAKIYPAQRLDIRGKMKTRMMTPRTVYGAFLVYKLDGPFKGPAKAMIRFVDDETDGETESRADIVHLQHVDDTVGPRAVQRTDGWMEVRLGEFYVGYKDDREVEARLTEKKQWKPALFINGIEFRPVRSKQNILNTMKAEPVAKNEESEDTEIDISLLQQFAPPSLEISSDPIAPSGHNWSLAKAGVEGLDTDTNLSANEQRNTHRSSNHKEGSSHSTETVPEETSPEANRFCPNWNLKNNNSLQDQGVGVEMMSKLLLPEDDRALASLTRNEIISGGYGCLSEAVYFFHGMKKLVEQKEREINDLKYKLLKREIDAQFVLGAKDSELKELRQTVEALKVKVENCEQRAEEDKKKADERLKEVEQKLVNSEARAAVAVEGYRNSEELKVEKHKFASKAFSIGFELCKKQVLEIDPGFDIRLVDAKKY